MAPQHRATICVFLYLFIRKLTHNHVWSKKRSAPTSDATKQHACKTLAFKRVVLTHIHPLEQSLQQHISALHLVWGSRLRRRLRQASAGPGKRIKKNIITIKKNPAKLIVPLTIFYGFPQVFMVLLQFSMAFINLSTCFLRFSIRFIDFSTVVLQFSVAFLDFATFFFNFLWHHRFSIVWFSFHVFNGLSIVL